MPSFYAHQVFGALVWEALPASLRTDLASQESGFRMGLYGPDPLFFYRPAHRAGRMLHRQSPRAVLEQFATREARSTPQALGYAAGFLCHYRLDAACHPYILAHCRGRSLAHCALEGAFDRLLIPKGVTGLPASAPDSETCHAAALGYDSVVPGEFALAARRFCLISRLTARLRRLPMVRRHLSAVAQPLVEQMRQEVADCAALIVRLAEAFASDAPLDFLPATDFSGRETSFPALP